MKSEKSEKQPKKPKRLRRPTKVLLAIDLIILVLIIAWYFSGFNIAQLFYHGKTREYWIAAVPEKWNIMPTGVDGMTGAKYTPQETTMEALIYRAYTPGWKKALPDEYGGMPGPMIHAEVGDTVIVHFKNLDTYYKRPHSMHPHGLHYTPTNDGAYVYSNQQPGDAVGVGHTYTYTWTAGSDSVGDWIYHDHSVDSVDNTTLGMYGLIEVTKPGAVAPQKQMVTFFDEMTSESTGLPNEYDTINGHAFVGNTPTYTATVGDRIQWIVAAVGSDFHDFHIHGHRWKYDGRDQDLLELGPAEAKSVWFTENAPGTWLVHCHVDEHMMQGMSAQYEVTDKNGVNPSSFSQINTQQNAQPPMPQMHMDPDGDMD